MRGEFTQHADFLLLEFPHWAIGLRLISGDCSFKFDSGVYDRLKCDADLKQLQAEVQRLINKVVQGPAAVPVTEEGLRRIARDADEYIEGWVRSRGDRAWSIRDG